MVKLNNKEDQINLLLFKIQFWFLAYSCLLMFKSIPRHFCVLLCNITWKINTEKGNHKGLNLKLKQSLIWAIADPNTEHFIL